MRKNNIGGYRTLDEYIFNKSKKLKRKEACFDDLFELMFSERDNIFWESNNGYKIIKTSYGQAYDSIKRKACSLKKILEGLNGGNMVGLYMQNSIEWIEYFWAILKCGYCPLLLNTRMDTEILEGIIKEYDVPLVISDGREFSVKTVEASSIVEGEAFLEDIKCGEELFIMSSGTTNSVKICSYDAKAIYEQILNAEEIVKSSKLIKKHYEGEIKLLTFLPFYHIFGLTALYMWFAFYQRTFVQLNDMSAHCILNTIRRHNVTHIFAVPLFWEKVFTEANKKIKERGEGTYKKLKKALKISNSLDSVPPIGKLFRKIFLKEVRDNLFGESISFMISGGGFIKNEVMEFFNGIGYHLSNGYGMTEIGITSVELSERNKILNSCTIGKPMTSVQYKINDEGQLLIKGTSLCKYYYEGGKKIVIEGNWFNSKDLAKEVKGRYYLLGRTDDLIVSTSGENLNPALTEVKITSEHIKGVCLIKGGEDSCEPILLVEVNKYLSSEKLYAVSEEIKGKLNEMNLSGEIKKIVFVGESLIKGDEFKLNRRRLSKDYTDGRLSLVELDRLEKNEAMDEFEQKVAECFSKALGKEIGMKDDFFLDAGGTSMDYFTMISYIQAEFDVVVPLSNEEKMTTIESLSLYLKDKM